jgi:hypothetical protein
MKSNFHFKYKTAIWLSIFLFPLLFQIQIAYSIEQDTSDVLWWRSFQPETIGNAMFSADGTKIYVSTGWTELHNYVLDAETGQIIDTIPGSIRTIFGVSQDGNFLYYNGISKVDAKTNKVVGSPEYLYSVIQADLAKNGKFFIIVPGASPGLYESPLVKYDAETLKPIKQSNFGMERIVKIHPNTTEFAVCTKQYDYWNYYSIIVSGTETMGVGKEIARFETEPSDMAYSSDGKWFAVAIFGHIYLYDVSQNYKLIDSITGSFNTRKIIFSNNSKCIIYGRYGYPDFSTWVYNLDEKIIKYNTNLCIPENSLDFNKVNNSLLIGESNTLYNLSTSKWYPNSVVKDIPKIADIKLNFDKTRNVLLVLSNKDYQVHISIADPLGKRVFTLQEIFLFANQTNEIQLPKLATGLYLVTIEYNGKSITQKIIVD